MPPKQLSFLPEIDAELTQKAMEDHFEKYRFYQMIGFEEREASITANYSSDPKSGSPTNVTSDPTANIAIYNVDTPREMHEYCERTERAVNRLPAKQKLLIKERYMSTDVPFDYVVYNQLFNPPISATTYAKIRADAFYTLAFQLHRAVIKKPADIDITDKPKK